MSERIASLAAAVFAAYARNAGHAPSDHYARAAAEQWMEQALTECGVPVSWCATSDALTNSAPARVWLQVDTDGNADDRSEPIRRENWSDLTWCYESIGGQEVTYTRDDLVAELVEIQRRLVAWNHNVNGDGVELGEICDAAESALARIAPNELHDKAAELRGRGE